MRKVWKVLVATSLLSTSLLPLSIPQASAGTSSTFATAGTFPSAITIDSAGNLYVANRDSNTVSKITPLGSQQFSLALEHPLEVSLSMRPAISTPQTTFLTMSQKLVQRE